jgi:hypothetical protein
MEERYGNDLPEGWLTGTIPLPAGEMWNMIAALQR